MTRIIHAACLSIRQPWAWLIAQGFKRIENRTWPSPHRGRLLIHAGKAFDDEGYDWVRYTFPVLNLPAPEMFERGGIVGVCTMKGCIRNSLDPWFCGPYGFILEDAQPLAFMRLRGRLGFWMAEYHGELLNTVV